MFQPQKSPPWWEQEGIVVRCLLATVWHQPHHRQYPWQGDERLRVWRIDRGEAVLEWENGGQTCYQAGEGFILKPWQRYRQRWTDRSTARTSGGWFLLQTRDGLDPLIQYRFPEKFASGELTGVMKTCARLSESPQVDDLSHYLHRHGLTHTFLGQVMALGEGSVVLLDRRLQDLVGFMRANLHQRILRQDLAAHFGCSEASLYNLFREHFHISPMVYLRRLRLEQVRRLVLREDHNLEEIAERCGFSDGAHLSRTFKQNYGISPNAWRMQRNGDTASEPL